MNQIEVTAHPDFDGHEVVEFRHNGDLTAIIAVHNTNLGPAVGGCRMFPYASSRDALTDVLRLSRGMTYKSALAGLPLGGGKAVIMADPQKDKTRDLLLAMGDFVESLGGKYITAEDSGTGVADIAVIGERTRHVSGVKPGARFGGDPSPVTAHGVFVGIKAAVSYRCHADLTGIRVAVQGVGNVGYHLAEMLVAAGAKVMVADVNPANLARVSKLGVQVVSPDQILSAEVDVLAPCAMGGAVNRDTVYNIRAGIVAGAANNQLQSPSMGDVLMDRGILYAPDYVINAGGIIDVFYQTLANQEEAADRQVARIGETLTSIFLSSDLQRVPTNQVADRMAEAVFNRRQRQVA